MDALLKVKDLHVYYGMIHAIRGISFEVNRGEIVTLIGANGAGKNDHAAHNYGTLAFVRRRGDIQREKTSPMCRAISLFGAVSRMFRRAEESSPSCLSCRTWNSVLLRVAAKKKRQRP